MICTDIYWVAYDLSSLFFIIIFQICYISISRNWCIRCMLDLFFAIGPNLKEWKYVFFFFFYEKSIVIRNRLLAKTYTSFSLIWSNFLLIHILLNSFFRISSNGEPIYIMHARCSMSPSHSVASILSFFLFFFWNTQFLISLKGHLKVIKSHIDFYLMGCSTTISYLSCLT